MGGKKNFAVRKHTSAGGKKKKRARYIITSLVQFSSHDLFSPRRHCHIRRVVAPTCTNVHTLLKRVLKRINHTTALGTIRPGLYPVVWEVTGELTSAFSCLGPKPKSDFFLRTLRTHTHTQGNTHFPWHVDHLISGLNW